MDSLKVYKSRFAKSGWRIFNHAIKESHRRKQNHVAAIHIVNALAHEEPDLFNAVMRDLMVNRDPFAKVLEAYMAAAPSYSLQGIRLAPETIDVFKRALERARANGRRTIEAIDLFIALSQEEDGVFHRALGEVGIDFEAVVNAVSNHIPPDDLQEVRVAPQFVRIRSGPYTGFTGRIEEFGEDKSTLKVHVTIFGRSTLIELSSSDVEEIAFV